MPNYLYVMSDRFTIFAIILTTRRTRQSRLPSPAIWLHAYRNVTVTNNGNIAIQGTFPPRGEANRGGGGGGGGDGGGVGVGTLYLVN